MVFESDNTISLFLLSCHSQFPYFYKINKHEYTISQTLFNINKINGTKFTCTIAFTNFEDIIISQFNLLGYLSLFNTG